MIFSITGWFTVPNYRFDVSHDLLKLVIDSFATIIDEYVGKKVNQKELEIYLATDGTSQKRKVLRRFEKSNKYLTYEFWLPYPNIVNNEVLDLQVFIYEFTSALSEALLDFAIPDKLIAQTTEAVKTTLQNNPEKYTFVLTEKEQNYRFALKNLKQTLASTKEKA